MIRIGLAKIDEYRFCTEDERTPEHLVAEYLAIVSLRKELQEKREYSLLEALSDTGGH